MKRNDKRDRPRCRACGKPEGTCEEPEVCEDRIVGFEVNRAENEARRDAGIERRGARGWRGED